MDFYNSLKPLLLTLIFIIAGARVIKHLGKNETKDMWLTIGIGALVYFFVNGPQQSLTAFGGLINALLNWIQGLGG